MAHSHPKARERHETTMHGEMWEDLVLFLVKKVITENPSSYTNKVIQLPIGSFSYQEALEILQNDVHSHEAVVLFKSFKNTLGAFFMTNPQDGFLELKKSKFII